MQEVAERRSLKTTIARAARDVSKVVLFVLLLAAIREYATFGTVGQGITLATIVPPDSAGLLPFLGTAPGALLILALFIAAANTVQQVIPHSDESPADDHAQQRGGF